ncbi:MAG: hypothetical protein HYX34_14005 [Actinobacteria bacterium]|nr:hypothetical protein [Actinomycetota bacterium]
MTDSARLSATTGAPSGPPGPSPCAGLAGSAPLAETARRLGRHAWLELRLFEVVGGWVGAERDPAAKVAYSRWSAHHAWHGELLRGLLPTVAELPAGELVAPAGREVAELADALQAMDDPDHTVERLAACARVVLPRLVSAARAHLGRTSEIADQPVRRVLRLLLGDEEPDWHEAEALLQRVMVRDGDTGRAADAQRRLEALAAAGPLDGGGRPGATATAAPTAATPRGPARAEDDPRS